MDPHPDLASKKRKKKPKGRIEAERKRMTAYNASKAHKIDAENAGLGSVEGCSPFVPEPEMSPTSDSPMGPELEMSSTSDSPIVPELERISMSDSPISPANESFPSG